MKSSDSFVSLNGSAGGAVVGYDKVIVLNGENGEGGKTEYSYINEPDYIAGYSGAYSVQEKPPYNSTVANASNGSLTKQVEYVEQGSVFKKVKEINNTYATDQTQDNEVFGMERRETQWNYYLNGSPSSSRPAGGPFVCDDVELFAYRTLLAKFNYLLLTEEKFFNADDSTKVVIDLTYFFHDNPKHLLTTRTVKINSKGEKLKSNVTYPLDYIIANTGNSISQGIESLKSRNIVAAPVETYTSISNGDDTNFRVTSAQLATYNPTTAFPQTIYQVQSVAPLTTFAPMTITASTVTIDPNYKSLLVFDNYDSKGNLLQQHKTDDVYHNYQWAYNSSFPIAEVTSSLDAITVPTLHLKNNMRAPILITPSGITPALQ